MPPTSEIVLFNKSRAERKVSVRYVDVDGHPQEKQMPFSEFQSFCIAWHAQFTGPRQAEDPKPILADSAHVA